MTQFRTTPGSDADSPVEQRVDFGESAPPQTGEPEMNQADRALSEPTVSVVAERCFTLTGLAELRAVVGEHASRLGVPRDRAADFVLAVDEIACNSVKHGGGHGVLRLWPEPDWLVCEVRDRGIMPVLLPERPRPGTEQVSGRGLWLADELCDRLEIRSDSDGTVVRAGVRRG